MSDSTGTVIEAQVDWLTCSVHGKEAADNLYLYSRQLETEQQRRGNRVRFFRLMGYEGHRCGAVEWGIDGGLDIIAITPIMIAISHFSSRVSGPRRASSDRASSRAGKLGPSLGQRGDSGGNRPLHSSSATASNECPSRARSVASRPRYSGP